MEYRGQFRSNWLSFIFGNLEKCFHTSQTAKTFSSFTVGHVISLVDAREGFFPFRSHFEKVLKFCPLAEKRGSLEGVRERGFKLQVLSPVSSFSCNAEDPFLIGRGVIWLGDAIG